ncbi:RNA polymerase sigma-70 factor, ECF subfamily [Chitinophaga sancti]|uniref:RNA polymerase sigma-70 factor, ECF subfamily n=2 Tax=Chitinophaga sancti TaxID=1004 RepID=A0A1K1S4B8_9BACT|nr:RNA polymerase sigma-70 factor, ECF subfamily [Chitinophaga sancti]
MTMQHFSDSELLTSMARGDEAAFTEIYHRYWQQLLAIAWKHTYDESSAKEIVQEVLIKLWDRRESLEIRELSHYLATAIKFSVFKHYHQQQRRKNILHSIFRSTHNADEEKIYARLLDDYINGIVEKLPEKCRQVYKLSRVEGKSNQQIAGAMNISEKTAEAHLTKALRTIRLNLRHINMLFFI